MAEEDKKADAEHEDKKADAEAGHQLDKMLTHVADSLEHMHKRMDAFEEEKAKGDAHRRKDAKRRDEDEDEHHREDDDDGDEAERTAADGKKRKDAHRKDAKKDAEEEEHEKKDSKADAKKADGEEEGEKKEDHAKKDAAKGDSKADSVDMAAVLKQVEELKAAIPRSLGDADYYAITDAQVRADEIYALFGQNAPRPQLGDTVQIYERRCVRDLRKHSKTWGGEKLNDNSAAFADDTLFATIRDQVYAEATETGKRADGVEAGMLRPVTKRTPSGHQVVEYYGEPRSWMNPMAGPVQQRTLTGTFKTQ